jgi:hypothetical protein
MNRTQALRLASELEAKVAAMPMAEVEAKLATITEWRAAIAQAQGNVDRRSLLADILYLDLIEE